MKIARLTSEKDKRAAAALMAASDPWLALGLDARACLRGLAAPGREIYAARSAGEFAGFVVLTMFGTFRGYVQTLFVAPAARGGGVGEALMAFAERRVFSETPNLFLCVSSFNKGAQRFYRRLGYAKAGVLKDFIIKGADELLLRKTLGPLRSYVPRRKHHG